MQQYTRWAIQQSRKWQAEMQKRPSALSRVSQRVQAKVNAFIPEKAHRVITAAIRHMVEGVLFGARHLSRTKALAGPLHRVEAAVEERIRYYKHAAAAEGGLTGAGGFWTSMADFPLLLGFKLKLLFDVATLYGYNLSDYRERVYLLHIFQLAFSSQERRRTVFAQMQNWSEHAHELPEDVQDFDWRRFQQEYRDYIDIAKMAQLIPGIGAVVGFVANYQLVDRLGQTAMNAYRMRWMEEGRLR
ncbi:EcsC family protein [Flaviaesturariibacter aridisoli]|uniref:EcsC family protein n=1 Tax=Flaviaesturariibacter aridisoli TaxID=2545761 RepID=A0A4R4E2Z6_9BACT|nr:EcsC family protein [Flaviaesturariibacter aridisoli]TCZ70155.1 EcsC family protein [Flaviaesturariibacter aridisoli]